VANLGGDVNSMVPKHVAKSADGKSFKQERLLSEKYLTYFKKARRNLWRTKLPKNCIIVELVKANARYKAIK